MVPLAYFLLLFLMIIVPVPTKINEKHKCSLPLITWKYTINLRKSPNLRLKKEPF